MTPLDFDETIEVLHGWLGQEAALWVDCSGESVVYAYGHLEHGRGLPPLHGDDDAGMDGEVLVFELGSGDNRCGFFLGRKGFSAEDTGAHGLVIQQAGAVELRLALRGPAGPALF
jgi:hypothetical protein